MLAAALAFAVSAAAPPVALAVHPFAAVGVDPEIASAISERFSQELAKTPLQVVPGDALGGCADEDCIAEMTNPPDVDAILFGRVSRLDDEYHVELRVLDELEGPPLVVYSVDAGSDRLDEHLAHAAKAVANAVLVEHARLGIAVGALKHEEPSVRADLPKNVLTFSPPGLLFGFYGVEYERVLGEQVSVFGSATLIALDYQVADYDATVFSLHGFLLSLGARWYPWRDAPSGFFVGVEARAGNSTWTTFTPEHDPAPYSEGGFALLPAGMVGYTFFSADRFPISFGLGLGYNGIRGVMPAIGPIARVSTGVAF